MITIQKAVKNILFADIDATQALERGFINYSAYAKQIKTDVEAYCMKEVQVSTIMVALTRISKSMSKVQHIIQDVILENITTYAPLIEIAFVKNIETIAVVSNLSTLFSTRQSDFFTTIIGTSHITIICSQRLEKTVLKSIVVKPSIHTRSLAAIGIAVDDSYYPLPNITYSLLHRIAQKKIPLAETITSHQEILFIFDAKYLASILKLFPIHQPIE